MSLERIFGALIVAGALTAPITAFGEAPESALARCLTEKGVTLYVADWCPYCRRLLDDFGPAAATLKITHCFDAHADKAACKKLDLPGVPTWIMPDPQGRNAPQRLVGYTPIRTIAEWSGCADRE